MIYLLATKFDEAMESFKGGVMLVAIAIMMPGIWLMFRRPPRGTSPQMVLVTRLVGAVVLLVGLALLLYGKFFDRHI